MGDMSQQKDLQNGLRASRSPVTNGFLISLAARTRIQLCMPNILRDKDSSHVSAFLRRLDWVGKSQRDGRQQPQLTHERCRTKASFLSDLPCSPLDLSELFMHLPIQHLFDYAVIFAQRSTSVSELGSNTTSGLSPTPINTRLSILAIPYGVLEGEMGYRPSRMVVVGLGVGIAG